MRTALILTSLLAFATSQTLVADNWPHWRGPSRNGSSAETGLPVRGEPPASRTLQRPHRLPHPPRRHRVAAAWWRRRWRWKRPRRWRLRQEGRPSHRSPAATSRRRTSRGGCRCRPTAVRPHHLGRHDLPERGHRSQQRQLELWAVDRRTQAVAWKRPVADGNHMERKQNMSSPSPVTDGRHVWVMTGVGVRSRRLTSRARRSGRATSRRTTAVSVSSGATPRRRCSRATPSTCRCCTG